MAPQRAVSCAKGTNPSFDRRHMRYVHLSILRITKNAPVAFVLAPKLRPELQLASPSQTPF